MSMVNLHITDVKQRTLLESFLINSGIEYSVVIDTADKHSLGFPHLVVDGVPLDMIRAVTWIKEHMKNE